MRSVILVFSICILLMGCGSNEVNRNEGQNVSKQDQTISMSEFNVKDEMRSFNTEIKDLSQFTNNTPSEFNLSATIDLQVENDADRIVYLVAVSNPKQKLSRLMVSFSLHPDMLPRLNTPNVVMSNVESASTNNIQSESPPYGYKLYRGFILDKSRVDDKMLSIFRKMYVKISFDTIDGNRKEQYFYISADPSKEIMDYITKASSK